MGYLPRSRGGWIAFAIVLAWGPGLVAAAAVFITLRDVPLSVLAFSVITAIVTIVLGATGSVLAKRRQERR